MSQYDYGVLNPAETTGTELADLLTQHKAALHSLHSGSARPAYAIAGTMWLDTTSDPYQVKLFDGGADTVLLEANVANDAPIHRYAPELSIASAATCAIGGVKSNRVLITGTTTINSFGSSTVGVFRYLRFAGALTLTYNATNMILPGGTSILTGVGDTMLAVCEGAAGAWRVLWHQRASGGAAPVGAILPYAGTTAPQGWLFCNGQNVSRTTYATLFAAIGTTHGVGDGSTTFGLPDLRGRAVFGKDDMGGSATNRITVGNSGLSGVTLGASGGDEKLFAHNHGYTGGQNVNHQHGYSRFADLGAGFVAGAMIYQVNGTITRSFGNTSDTSGSENLTHLHLTNYTFSGTAQNMPPAIIMNYLIFAGG